jgi:two-component system, LytTR family, sensor kinase
MKNQKLKKIIIKVLAASILCFIYTSIFGYILYGSLDYDKRHLIFDFAYAFVFFILLYEGYLLINEYLVNRLFGKGQGYWKYLAGLVFFVIYSVHLLTIVAVIPFMLIFEDFIGAVSGDTELRLNYTINMLFASFYYAVLTGYQILKNEHETKLQAEQLQKEIARAQFESLKHQVNPHFLFNSLNVLTSLISIDPVVAEKFTEQLSKVYRYILEHKGEDLVPLKSEIDFIYSYIFLLEIRFKDKLQVQINLPSDELNLLIPPLTLQLLVENAIKHNSFSKKEPLHIVVSIDTPGYLSVVNNCQSRDEKLASTGVGLKNITNRYSYLTDKEPYFGYVNGNYIAKIPLL